MAVYGIKNNKCLEQIDDLIKAIQYSGEITLNAGSDMQMATFSYQLPEGYTAIGADCRTSECCASLSTNNKVVVITTGTGTAMSYNITVVGYVYCVKTSFVTGI